MTAKKKQDPVAAYLAANGRKGGKARSDAKAAAAQANGRKGGRPPTKSKAERLALIRARVAADKPLTPPQAALYFAAERGEKKAHAWALKQWVDAPKASVERDWWDAVVANLERGAQ